MPQPNIPWRAKSYQATSTKLFYRARKPANMSFYHHMIRWLKCCASDCDVAPVVGSHSDAAHVLNQMRDFAPTTIPQYYWLPLLKCGWLKFWLLCRLRLGIFGGLGLCWFIYGLLRRGLRGGGMPLYDGQARIVIIAGDWPKVVMWHHARR